MFVNFVCPPKLANIPPCYVFLIQIIEGNCIFSNSLAKLANMVQDQKVDKHTPPSRGGLKGVQKESQWNQKEPKGARREPKGIKKGAKREPKGAKRD